MVKITDVALDVHQVIKESGRIQIDGAIGIFISNNGDVDALINGNLTLKPCGVFSMATPNENVVINDYLTVWFPDPNGARLEVVTMRVKGKEHSNY